MKKVGVLLTLGAGDGNRTRVTSLEGWCSTIELHRRMCPRLRSYRAAGLPVFPGCQKQKEEDHAAGHLSPRGAPSQTRTDDLLITNQPLYQLQL